MNITDILISFATGTCAVLAMLGMCYVSFRAGYIKAIGDCVTFILTKREKEGDEEACDCFDGDEELTKGGEQ